MDIETPLEESFTLGMLPRLFTGLGSQDESNIKLELIVLWHCIVGTVEGYNEHSLSHTTGGKHDFTLSIHLCPMYF